MASDGPEQAEDMSVCMVLCQIEVLTVENILLCLYSPNIITLRTGDADLRFYITTVQDG